MLTCEGPTIFQESYVPQKVTSKQGLPPASDPVNDAVGVDKKRDRASTLDTQASFFEPTIEDDETTIKSTVSADAPLSIRSEASDEGSSADPSILSHLVANGIMLDDDASSTVFHEKSRTIRSNSMPLENHPKAQSKSRTVRSRSAVSFHSVSIREYDQTVGDNPSCSYGCPISLDWTYVDAETVPLGRFEAERAQQSRQNPRTKILSYYTRKHVLTWVYGHTAEELKSATKEANQTKTRRWITRILLPVSKLEEASESAVRKIKRAKNKVLTQPPT